MYQLGFDIYIYIHTGGIPQNPMAFVQFPRFNSTMSSASDRSWRRMQLLLAELQETQLQVLHPSLDHIEVVRVVH